MSTTDRADRSKFILTFYYEFLAFESRDEGLVECP